MLTMLAYARFCLPAALHLPPTNQSTFHQWTIGPIYYAALVTTEAIGPSSTTQVLDLGANSNNEFTSAYALFEAGTLFNYATDPSGASNVMAEREHDTELGVGEVSAGSEREPEGELYTSGGNFGRLTGTENVTMVAQTCAVTVPTPGFALVFLSDGALTEDRGAPSTMFATTAVTKTQNTGAY
ncbi:hypothetical protein B0H17DRAFT_1130690 [Mycena rosella]|uniref:Uncharacterized protein n=1 Tax=Mycena rosella TaxID=1033263 RepID=A0AAD7GNA0_MYCRO|nr:hypothetical protein B0H17DRAFT_1130690 [Mycena rosella]